MEKKKITPKDFIKAWVTSNSMAEVQQKTGLSAGAIRFRVHHYRHLGVDLNPFSRRPVKDREDWKKLADFAKEAGLEK